MNVGMINSLYTGGDTSGLNEYVSRVHNRLSDRIQEKNKGLFSSSTDKSINASADKISEKISLDGEIFSSSRLNSMRDNALRNALSKYGYTNSQLSGMQPSEMVNLRPAIIKEAQHSVKSAVRSDLMEQKGTTFLRGEQLSNEVVATLLFSI